MPKTMTRRPKVDKKIVIRNDGDVFVQFPYDETLVREFNEWRGKNQDGTFQDNSRKGLRFINGKDTGTETGWVIPADHVADFVTFAQEHEFDVSPLDNFKPRFVGNTAEGDFYLRFPYRDEEVRQKLKTDVPGATWNKAHRVWTVPASSVQELMQFTSDADFENVDEVKDLSELDVI